MKKEFTIKIPKTESFGEGEAHRMNMLLGSSSGFLLFTEKDDKTCGLIANHVTLTGVATLIHELLSNRPEVKILLMLSGDIPTPNSICELAKFSDSLIKHKSDDRDCNKCDEDDCPSRKQPMTAPKPDDEEKDFDPKTAAKWK